MRALITSLLTGLALYGASAQVSAENLDVLMSGVFQANEATYIGYESVEREDIPVQSQIERKYLIVDFRFQNQQLPSEQLQASVHKVCMTLLKDRELIRSLSDSGYDMVSVAFDRQSQFDCL
ncbi:hypothetical protein KUV44_09045 [Marinobacter daepoensis]|uniref:Uncharacterized protein n=1 Tax=Marinobacter daepoensis TaxID=262077 RepID=A0ABS3BCG3_9GAMM|nr:hypothetical protein [Marinobacter daepoensis]MBN7768546.1 hypothetical protein [Marinobacter daepoensis]MBY6033002.1 hypothetical protein [Marinobacter daepoensis]MBY6079283.1 hypothetical protein [Marinobacter daepoensis]